MCVLDIQLLITFKILISFLKLQIFNLEYGRGRLRLVCNFHATMAEDFMGCRLCQNYFFGDV